MSLTHEPDLPELEPIRARQPRVAVRPLLELVAEAGAPFARVLRQVGDRPHLLRVPPHHQRERVVNPSGAGPERGILADAPAAPLPRATAYCRAFRWIVLPTPRTSATVKTVKGSVRRTKAARRLDITSCCVT